MQKIKSIFTGVCTALMLLTVACDGAAAAGLSRTESHGADLSGKWRNTPGVVTYGPDGKIIYLFGYTQPTVVCSPLQICEVELQAGETVRDVMVGDTVRWKVSPATSGSEDGQCIHLMIKATEPGIETSLVVTTSRRTYHIKLKSDPRQYMARVGFEYPEDTQAKVRAFNNQVEETLPGTNATAENLTFDYAIGGNARWRPTRVYTDGVKTYIQFSGAMSTGDAPVLYVVTGGDNRIVNYRLKGTVMIVDYVFDRAVLLSGVGWWSQEKVTIDRRS